MAIPRLLFGLLGILILYSLFTLHPQIRELKRKLSLPEFQGTAHQQTMICSFQQLQRRSLRVRLLILILGVLTLGWMIRSLLS